MLAHYVSHFEFRHRSPGRKNSGHDPVLYSSQQCLFVWGSRPPSNMIPWTFQVPKRYRLSRILDRLGRLAGLAIVRDQQTDRHTDNCLQYANQATQSVAMGRIIHSPCMRCAAIRQQEVGQLHNAANSQSIRSAAYAARRGKTSYLRTLQT